MSFLDDILTGLGTISGYVAIAIQIITTFFDVMPKVVQFIKDAVDRFFPKIEAGEVTPAEARESVVASTLAEFHGSGTVVSEQDVRTILEQYVKLAKTKRGTFDHGKEKAAIEKGFVNQTELEKVRKVWKGFQPLD